MKEYKLTDEDMRTRGTEWTLNVPLKINKPGNKLCSNQVYHYYPSPEIASLVYPVHVDFKKPRLFECEIDKEVAFDGLKGGCKRLTLIKKIELPVYTVEQRVKFAILCALEVYKEESFKAWTTVS